MKKSIVCILVCCLAASLLCGAVAAATLTYNSTTGVYKVEHTDIALANKQVTIAVYNAGTTMSESTIQYIDQAKADASGKVVFEFIPKSIPTNLTVELGFEGGASKITVGTINKPQAGVNVTFSGVVSFAGTTAPLLTAKNLSTNKVTAIPVSTASATKGAFSVTVPSGDYEINASKTAHLNYTKKSLGVYNNTAFNIKLAAGNVKTGNATEVIDTNDIVLLLKYFNLSTSSMSQDKQVDINEDNTINTSDLALLCANFNSTATVEN